MINLFYILAVCAGIGTIWFLIKKGFIEAIFEVIASCFEEW